MLPKASTSSRTLVYVPSYLLFWPTVFLALFWSRDVRVQPFSLGLLVRGPPTLLRRYRRLQVLFRRLFPRFFSVLLGACNRFLFVLSKGLCGFFRVLFRVLGPYVYVGFVRVVPLAVRRLLRVSILFRLFGLRASLFLCLYLEVEAGDPSGFLCAIIRALSRQEAFYVVCVTLREVEVVSSRVLRYRVCDPARASLFSRGSGSRYTRLFVRLDSVLYCMRAGSS